MRQIASVLFWGSLVLTGCATSEPEADSSSSSSGDASPGANSGSSSGGSSAASSGSGGVSDAGPDAAAADRCAAPPCASGQRCKDDGDCASSVCRERTCIAASGGDKQKNGSETDVDCGGDPAGAARCDDAKACLVGSDCVSGSCPGGTCAAPSNDDQVRNGTETGIDCGGGAPTHAIRCPVGGACIVTSDCDAVACANAVCQSASAHDQIQNGTETGVDCGGPAADTSRCPTGTGCNVASDCDAVACEGGVCQPPTNADQIQNGTETGVDCGGGAPTDALRCAVGGTCTVTSDCDNVACGAGLCQPPGAHDGLQNGSETGIDCGGGAPTNADRCAVGQACTQGTDCLQAGCVGNLCAWTGSDGYQNGSETDVDCGGAAPTNAGRCALDKTCITHVDCASSACAISGPKAGKCVPVKSCVNNNGGFTCGKGDSDFYNGGANAYESCCDTAPLTATTTRLDRFAITAGRMRAFIERLTGNVRAYVQNAATKPAGWNSNWDQLVPANIADAEMMLGPYWNNAPNDPNVTGEKPNSKRSCGYGAYNGHTYWISGQAANQVYTQAELDPKYLNCVGWHLVTAFCAWDGGRVASAAELRNAYTNGNTSTYPWGYAGSLYNTAWAPETQDQRLNHVFAYGFPRAQPASARITWWIAPPGRFWRGWNANKIEITGNGLEWTSNNEYGFVWNNSFEHHTGNVDFDPDWRSPNDRTDVPNGYYAMGARCAHDP